MTTIIEILDGLGIGAGMDDSIPPDKVFFVKHESVEETGRRHAFHLTFNFAYA